MLAKCLHCVCNGGTLLTDCNVDALHTKTALVDDGVDRNSGLTGLTVTNDEFALSTTNWGHCVDRLDAGLQWLVHWLATHDARSLDFHGAADCANDVTLTVDGRTKCVDNATKHRVTNWDGENATSCFNSLAFFNGVCFAEHNYTDEIFIKVESETNGSVLELKKFVHHAIRQARNAGDTVAHFCDATNSGCLE